MSMTAIEIEDKLKQIARSETERRFTEEAQRELQSQFGLGGP